MAHGMGVQAHASTSPGKWSGAIQQMLAHPGPFLLDLVLEGDTHPDHVGETCGQ